MTKQNQEKAKENKNQKHVVEQIPTLTANPFVRGNVRTGYRTRLNKEIGIDIVPFYDHGTSFCKRLTNFSRQQLMLISVSDFCNSCISLLKSKTKAES